MEDMGQAVPDCTVGAADLECARQHVAALRDLLQAAGDGRVSAASVCCLLQPLLTALDSEGD